MFKKKLSQNILKASLLESKLNKPRGETELLDPVILKPISDLSALSAA
jgi:hypothetical protein